MKCLLNTMRFNFAVPTHCMKGVIIVYVPSRPSNVITVHVSVMINYSAYRVFGYITNRHYFIITTYCHFIRSAKTRLIIKQFNLLHPIRKY